MKNKYLVVELWGNNPIIHHLFDNKEDALLYVEEFSNKKNLGLKLEFKGTFNYKEHWLK